MDDKLSQSVTAASTSPTLEMTISPTSLHVPSMLAVKHTGAVHEFLLLHFRLCHLNYNAMLWALQLGSWTGFRHCFNHIHLSQLPRCPVCLRMKNKHRSVSNVGRMV